MNPEPQNTNLPALSERASATLHLLPAPAGPDPCALTNGEPAANRAPPEDPSGGLPAGAGAMSPEAQNWVSDSQAPETPSTSPERRSRSKIGRLPKAIRDKLNFMLRDGVPYPDIRARLGDDAKDITDRNLSSWQSSPHHQRWLLEQDWLENLRDDQECALGILSDFDVSRFNEATLQLAVTRLFLALRHIDSGDLNQKLGGNAQTFSRLVHALARACRESTNIEKYRQACAQAVAAELKQMNTDRELADNEFQLVVKRMDRVFKVARPSSAAPAAVGQASPPRPPRQPSTCNLPPSTELFAATPHSDSVPVAIPSPRGEGRGEGNSAAQQPLSPPQEFLPPADLAQPSVSPGAEPSPAPSPSEPVEQTPVPPGPEQSPGASSPTPVPEPATCNQQPATSQSSSPQEDETCYDCAVTLPPLLPDGQRPSNTCRRCGAKLYPPGTKFDHCPFCDAAQPLPNNERISPDCRRCGGVLPPPGQRYVENCPGCGLKLPNITNEGTRLSPRCSDCGATLPLLEPAPACLNS